MWKSIILWLCLSSFCLAGPIAPKRNMPIIPRVEEDSEKESTIAGTSEKEVSRPEAATPSDMQMISTLTLPSNATSIRGDITDGFSCANKSYGYYADMENDCQIFHVCLPVTYADGRENIFRWSFICPEETIFSQESFTCMRQEDMAIDCGESGQYYELNRNFGITDEDDNKQMMNNNMNLNNNEDQETAMTSQMANKQSGQQIQVIIDDKVVKPKPKPVMIQKEKPMKVQKPNRRKPGTVSGGTFSKKKPADSLPEKAQTEFISETSTPLSGSPASTAAAAATTSAKEETKPHRFTKRPPLMSVNLREKPQPVRQSEPTPMRVELFNQKRKRPSIFNKKEATTLKPAEENQPATELATADESVPALETQSSVDLKAEPEDSTKTSSIPDLNVPQASETSNIVLVAEPSSSSNDSQIIEIKKISKPQPTEPETVSRPEITEADDSPVIEPLEAVEEIPAVITEVEETNTGLESHQTPQEVNLPLGVQESSSEMTLSNLSYEKTSAETDLNVSNISEKNSEEIVPNIEDMEEQKPDNAPETMPSKPDMEQQDPIVEQMLSSAESEPNKETMGGFKPVDPAMAAEAEALIANFLNTLMKNEKTNAEPVMPTNDLEKENSKNSNEEETLTDEKVASEENQSQTMETESQETNSNLKTHAELEPNTPPQKQDVDPISNLATVVNNLPGEVYQIPVQIIESPIEEIVHTQSLEEIPVSSPENLNSEMSLEGNLEHVPQTDTEKQIQSQSIESSGSEEGEKVETLSQEQSEPLILPIYHRLSAEPNSNMISALSKNENLELHQELPELSDTENAATMLETETEKNTAELKAPTNADTRSNSDRAFRARSIKTAAKMDPRKRRFLFKSDAS